MVKYCERCGDPIDCPPSREDRRRQCSECFQKHGHTPSYKEDMSKSMSGQTTWDEPPMAGKSHTEEAKQKISDAHIGKEFSDTHRRRIAESRKALAGQEIEKYDQSFKSQWEVETAIVLEENNIEWEYEPEIVELDTFTYVPDFYANNWAIEVKGHVWREETIQQLERFIKNTNRHVLAVGAQLPCDAHVSYEERNTIPEII